MERSVLTHHVLDCTMLHKLCRSELQDVHSISALLIHILKEVRVCSSGIRQRCMERSV